MPTSQLRIRHHTPGNILAQTHTTTTHTTTTTTNSPRRRLVTWYPSCHSHSTGGKGNKPAGPTA